MFYKKGLVSLLIATGTLVFASIQVSASGFDEFTNIEARTCLGKTIDVVGAKNYGDFAICDVLDKNYYNNLGITRNNYYHGFDSRFYSADSKEKILFQIDADYSQSTSVGGLNIKGFTLGAKNRYNIADSLAYSSYYSRSFVEFVGQYDEAKYYIPDAVSSTKRNEFKNNLSTAFIESLDDLSRGELSYPSFFRAFGSHIVTNYISGDRIYCDGYMVSNETLISNKFETNFKTSMSATFTTLSANVDKSFDICSEYGISKNKSHYGFNISCASGIKYKVSSYSELGDCLANWCQNVANCENTVVGYDFDNLVPIWDVLPNNSPISKAKMIEEFVKYKNANEINYAFEDVKLDINLSSENKTIRTDPRNIDDEDRFTYKEDFKLDDTYGIDIIKDAFSEIEFSISLDARRVDKGYQYVYLYNKSDADNKNYDKYLYESPNFNLSTKFTHYTVTFNVDTRYLVSHDLTIVWRAKGNGDDRWCNQNVILNINYIRK